MNAKLKDPTKEAALWTAIRALDAGNRRAVDESEGRLYDCGSWREQDARRVLFLKYRYQAGEWDGDPDRARPGGENLIAALRGEPATW